MLSELRIRDLAIIEGLDLVFGPGFNVLTGETGAGKSIIIDAVGLLLGDRASPEIVRGGADRAEVEGVFQLGPAAAARTAPLLAEQGLEGDQPGVLILAREVRATGRSVARVNCRAVSNSVLGDIGGLLVDVHGHGEHLSLLREREHIALLDRYAGLEAERSALAELVQRVRSVRRHLEALRQDERERARRIDLLTYQVQEIHAARLKPGEQEELESERRRLANAEQLAELSSEAVQLLQEGASAPMGEGAAQGGALDALGAAEHALARLARVDPQVGRFREQLAEAIALLDDLARELGRYRDEIEFNPRRLQQVEERLHLIHSLQRKYGDSIADVLAYAERAAAELETITHAEERIADLEAEETQLLTEIGAAGVALSAARRAAGERMARAIEIELDDLQMQGAAFGVQIAWTADPTGAFVAPGDATAVGEPEGRYAFHADGLDHVIFLVSANPGEPLRPLAKVASGGETSRLMLALKTVLGRADETPTLIFDEIDQGIGGRVGATVGKKLRGLARGQPVLAKPGGTGGRGQETGDRRQGSGGSVSWPVVQERLAEPGSAEGQPSAANNRPSHQVLCITHLPQLAAHGDVHFHVAKRVTGGRTLTGVQKLDGESRVAELARMMGTDTDAGRLSVLEMMHEVSN